MFFFRFKFAAPVAAVITLAGAGGAAQAQVLNIDFGPTGAPLYVGTAALPAGTGTFFNNVTVADNGAAFSAGPFLLSDGVTASGISLTSTAKSGAFNNNTGTTSPGATTLMQDYIYVTTNFGSATSTVTLTGLTAGATYNLYLYGAGDSAGQGTRFTVNSVLQSTTGPLAATSALTLGEDYVVFSGVAPTAGSLAITYAVNTTGGNQFSAFNGLQLQQVSVAVPEPGTLALAGLALPVLGLVARRRRK